MGAAMSMPPPPKGEKSSLTDDQAIVTALSEAGIQPGAGLETAMNDLGFDAKSIGDLAGVERQMPPPPPTGGEFNSGDSEIAAVMIDFLSELLSEKLENSKQSVDSLSNSGDLFQRAQQELTDADKQDVYAQLMEKFGLPEGESLIDITV